VKAPTAFTGLVVSPKALGVGWPMIDGNRETTSGDGEVLIWREAELGRSV